MTKVASVSDMVLESIWNYGNQMRGKVDASNLLLPIVYVLYGIYKGYGIEKTANDEVFFKYEWCDRRQ